jgi:hypothetical protein
MNWLAHETTLSAFSLPNGDLGKSRRKQQTNKTAGDGQPALLRERAYRLSTAPIVNAHSGNSGEEQKNARHKDQRPVVQSPLGKREK